MKFYLVCLFPILFIQACSSSGDGNELQGTWESICIHVINLAGPATGTSSTPPEPGPVALNTTPIKTVLTLGADTSASEIRTYEDDDCSVLSSSVNALEAGLYSVDTYPVTYEIGNEVQTINGVTVKELNFYNANGELIPDIYLLQDNATTLYLGRKCFPGEVCDFDRPVELNYDFYFTR